MASANAGMFLGAGLSYETGKLKSSEEGAEDVKIKGLAMTFGAGYSHDLGNNLFAGFGAELKNSMAKGDLKEGDYKEEYKNRFGTLVSTHFGYNFNEMMGAYVKLGYEHTRISAKYSYDAEELSKSHGVLSGFSYGIGMNMKFDKNNAMFVEIMNSNLKLDKSKFKPMSVSVGYRYFF